MHDDIAFERIEGLVFEFTGHVDGPDEEQFYNFTYVPNQEHDELVYFSDEIHWIEYMLAEPAKFTGSKLRLGSFENMIFEGGIFYKFVRKHDAARTETPYSICAKCKDMYSMDGFQSALGYDFCSMKCLNDWQFERQ